MFKRACQMFICSLCQVLFILHGNYLSFESLKGLAFKTVYLVRLLEIIFQCTPFFNNFLAFALVELVLVIYIFFEIFSFHQEFELYFCRTDLFKIFFFKNCFLFDYISYSDFLVVVFFLFIFRLNTNVQAYLLFLQPTS